MLTLRIKLRMGQDCKDFMGKLDLTPNNLQIRWLISAALKFHKTVAAQYMKYFKADLESKILRYCVSLDPKERSQPSRGF